MHWFVFLPKNLLGQLKHGDRSHEPLTLVGYRIDDSFIVIDAWPLHRSEDPSVVDPDLRIIGRYGGKVENPHSEMLYLKKHTERNNVEIDKDLCEELAKYSVILFSPPNLKNLEYFTINPILLHSTGQPRFDTGLVDRMDESHALLSKHDASESKGLFSNEAVLEKINKCLKTRAELASKSRKPNIRSTLSPKKSLAAELARFLIFLLNLFVSYILLFAVVLIKLLNTEFKGHSAVELSALCRQLDIRLRQITFFPIQYLCSYDPNLFNEELRKSLDLPLSNKRHNINNSNYINLYNSIWLMANDALLGRTVYLLLFERSSPIVRLVNDKMTKVAFIKIEELIVWIGSSHPAGFKLNDDLGKFMQAMFLWTSQSWREGFDLVSSLLQANPKIVQTLQMIFAFFCSCGFTFLLASFNDYAQLVWLHIYFFHMATAKIYNRQIEMLKSLTQLFRGKKYNVLRNRLDNIDEDQFHIDQLLLGTFCFMILLYLLPTVFAFYMFFFILRLALLTLLKIADKMTLCFNIYPLFVLLLKLKNSRRLQGGLHFKYIGHSGCTNWLTMENRALTVDEILRNFVHVFRLEGKFVRPILNFVEGHELQVKSTSSMKFHYLMLPGNYANLVEVWNDSTRHQN